MKWLWGIGGTLLILAGGVWLVSGSSNLPGEFIADLGREHWDLDKLVGVEYNSNPPTSGPHDPDWIRPGVYEVAQDKYKLIHSLEHGYVVIHYNCAIEGAKAQRVKGLDWISVSAHEDEGDLDNDEPDGTATPSGQIVSADCQQTKDTISESVKKLGLKRIIVTPNSDIDKRIIMVAWNRKLVLDPWDEKAAEKFARAYHNRGPEQTME